MTSSIQREKVASRKSRNGMLCHNNRGLVAAFRVCIWMFGLLIGLTHGMSAFADNYTVKANFSDRNAVLTATKNSTASHTYRITVPKGKVAYVQYNQGSQTLYHAKKCSTTLTLNGSERVKSAQGEKKSDAFYLSSDAVVMVTAKVWDPSVLKNTTYTAEILHMYWDVPRYETITEYYSDYRCDSYYSLSVTYYPVPKVSLGETSKKVPAGGGTYTLKVSVDTTDWMAESNNSSWIKVLSYGNGVVKYSVTKNETTESKSGGYILVYCRDTFNRLYISQEAGAATLSLGQSSATVDSKAGVASFDIKCNTDFTVKSSASWLSPYYASKSGNYTMNYRYDENISRADRSAVITVKAGNITKTLVVTQKGMPPKYVTVTFDANGGVMDGAETAQASYEDAMALGSLEVPTRKGHDFAGWWTQKDGGTKVSVVTKVSSLISTSQTSLTLYAHWTEKRLTITFEANDGSGMSVTQTAVSGAETVLRRNSFKREGYSFIGWDSPGIAKCPDYEDGATVYFLEDEVLYACWVKDPEYGYVRFYSEGGDIPGYYEYTIGEKFGWLPDVSRQGYIFAGWRVMPSGDRVTTASIFSGAETEIHACWTPIQYEIVFNANGAYGNMPRQIVSYGETVPLRACAFENTGYRFVGWALSENGAVVYEDGAEIKNLTDSAGKKIQLYAIWNRTSTKPDLRISNLCIDGADANHMDVRMGGYRPRVTVVNEGGGIARASKAKVGMLVDIDPSVLPEKTHATKTSGVALKSLPSFDEEGGEYYHYEYWDEIDVPSLKPGESVQVLGGVFPDEFYKNDRLWAYVDIENILDEDDEDNNAWPLGYYVYDSEEPPPDPTEGAYTLSLGSAADGDIIDLPCLRTKNKGFGGLFLNAYLADGDCRNCMFKINPLFSGKVHVSFLPSFDKIRDPVFLRVSGMAGWWTLAYDNDCCEFDLNFEESKNVEFEILHDNYECRVEGLFLFSFEGDEQITHKVQFDPAGGIVSELERIYDVTQPFGVLPTAEKSGYEFVGWYAETIVGSDWYVGNVRDMGRVTESIIAAGWIPCVRARWRANSYEVEYDRNDGSGTKTGSSKMTYDEEAELGRNEGGRRGYTFEGWSPTKTGSAKYAEGEKVENLTSEAGGKVTMYGVWEPNRYRVDFDGNGGTGSMDGQPMVFDEVCALRKNGFVRSGYDFIGWSLDGDNIPLFGDCAVVSNLVSVADAVVTLYAAWLPHSYRVVFEPNGALGAAAEQFFRYGECKVLDPCGFSRRGYCFVGWAETENGNVVYEDEGEVVNLTSEADGVVRLYAVWEKTAEDGLVQTGGTVYGFVGECPDVLIVEDGVTEISDFAFAGCSMSEVYLPPSVEKIGTGAFQNCHKLCCVHFGGNAPRTDGTLFVGAYEALVTLVPDGSTGWDGDGGSCALPAVWPAPSGVDARQIMHDGQSTFPVFLMDDEIVVGQIDVFRFGTYSALPIITQEGRYMIGWWTEPLGGSFVDPSDRVFECDSHVLYAHWSCVEEPWQEDGDFSAIVASVYDGYMINGEDNLVGIAQVKTTKQNSKGVVSATATVTDANGKKWSYSKGEVTVDGVVTGLKCTTKGCPVPEFDVKVGKNGMDGAWGEYAIFGARNGMGAKGDAMMAALEAYKGKWSVTLSCASLTSGQESASPLVVRLQFDVQAKGGVKIAGNWENGAKVSASAQMIMGDGFVYVPVMVKQTKTSPALNALLRIDANGEVALLSEGELVAGGRTVESLGEPVYLPSEVSVGGKAFGARVAVNELAYPVKFAAKKLPAGLKIDAATGVISGTPTKPGRYIVEVTVASGLNSKAKKTLTVEFDIANYTDNLIPIKDSYGPYYVGVSADERIAVAAGCSVSGLPSGLKWTAKDIKDSKTKTVKTAANTIYGVPTKTCTSTVYFKKSEKELVNGKMKSVTHQASATFIVEGMKPWAYGTFNGGNTNGIVTLTVSNVGKISGKWMSEGLTWTLSAASFDAYISSEQMYVATVIGKSGKLVMTNEIEVTENGVSSPLFEAWRNGWKEEPQKSLATKLKGQKAQVGEVLLTVGASGAVTAKGTFVTGFDEKKQKDITYSASCSTVLIPTVEADLYRVYLYFPPKSGKFDGVSTCESVMFAP